MFSVQCHKFTKTPCGSLFIRGKVGHELKFGTMSFKNYSRVVNYTKQLQLYTLAQKHMEPTEHFTCVRSYNILVCDLTKVKTGSIMCSILKNENHMLSTIYFVRLAQHQRGMIHLDCSKLWVVGWKERGNYCIQVYLSSIQHKT